MTDLNASLRASLHTTGIKLDQWEEAVGQDKATLKQAIMDYCPMFMESWLAGRDTAARRARYQRRELGTATNQHGGLTLIY